MHKYNYTFLLFSFFNSTSLFSKDPKIEPFSNTTCTPREKKIFQLAIYGFAIDGQHQWFIIMYVMSCLSCHGMSLSKTYMPTFASHTRSRVRNWDLYLWQLTLLPLSFKIVFNMVADKFHFDFCFIIIFNYIYCQT